MKMQEQVKEFHEKFGLKIAEEKEDSPNKSLIQLRISLIMEEFQETIEALDVLYRDAPFFYLEDYAKAIKELADLMYVVLGTAVSFGIDMEKVFDEVHRSNMSKVWEDGTIKRREDGKILKPPTYSPADIEKILTNTK